MSQYTEMLDINAEKFSPDDEYEKNLLEVSALLSHTFPITISGHVLICILLYDYDQAWLPACELLSYE